MRKAWIAGTVVAAALISLLAGSVLAEEGLCRVAPQCPVRGFASAGIKPIDREQTHEATAPWEIQARGSRVMWLE